MKSEAQFEEIICPYCGSTAWHERQTTKYTYRVYCKACGKWNRELDWLRYPKRIDTENQPSHCGKCKYFSEMVFECETQNGWASWIGDCLCQDAPRGRTISRYIGCKYGMKKTKKPEPEKKDIQVYEE